jgi:beta-lactam-binding protein with PASTA domain
MRRSTENKETKKKLPFYKTFLGTIVTILGICIVLYFTFFASLAYITGHGEELQVPDLKGKDLNEVYQSLESQGFGVVIDSTYEPELPALTILDQQPLPGNTVKPGRHIFLTINKLTPPNSSMPNLVNLSLRSAMLVLKSNKLLLGDTIVKDDMALGAVVGQIYNGTPVGVGTLIPQGSKIDLEVGGGFKSTKIVVPDVMHLTYDVAVSILSASGLKFDVIWEGPITDTANAVIFYQLPEGFDDNQEPITTDQGSRIDLKIRQNL